ncbi:hypothetical protein ACF3DV_28235 [Chlorogloeopsis fritschii PCC 9212]|jgi:hypothetical protein|uniref:hypothetical protein n=1 Tax=Chlorogloeopsis fritschii TaxID=1124 RepID=UPI0002F6BA69|nr:hypothetical protein [Chlorogloeopsis fritschii]MBF2006537.1 hypothetical protein [Chlorogloeopsis fritschii C42_A2020_084]
MCLIDGLLLTLVSTVVCLAFPKFLSMMTVAKSKATEPVPNVSAPQETGKEVPSYP